MKPLEFKIKKTGDIFIITFYYEDNSQISFMLGKTKPAGLEINEHYFIGDLYGYKVKDDREGL